MKQCEVCSMPMRNTNDHGGGDLSNTWCAHCCHADGSHKSYEDILQDMAAFMLSDECTETGMEKAKNQDEALARANAFMQEMPIWKKKKGQIH